MRSAKIRTPLALALTAGLSTPVLAFEPPAPTKPAEGKAPGEFDKPLKSKRREVRVQAGDAPRAQGQTHSQMVMTQKTGDRTYELRVEDGEASASVDGKEVPENRLRKTDGGYEILGEDGKALTSFEINQDGDEGAEQQQRRVFRFRGGDGAFGGGHGGHGGQFFQLTPRVRRLDRQMGWQQEDREPPKVMLGLSMSDPDESLREHLGFQEGIRVDSIVDDLPAAKAGIKVGEIILSLDGKEVSPQTLRDALEGKEAGQSVKLRVIAKGGVQPREVTLKLEAYDAQKLGITHESGADQADEADVFFALPPMGLTDETRRELEKALAQLEGGTKDINASKEEMLRAREQAIKALHEALAATKKGQGRGRVELYVDPNAQGFTPSLPIAPAPPANDRRLDKISEQLEKLSERLEKLEQKK